MLIINRYWLLIYPCFWSKIWNFQGSLQSKISVMGMWPVKSHRALGLEGPYIWFNALIYHLEMLDNSWTRNSTFSFCTEPYKLCSKPCTPRRNVFAEYHLTQIRAVFHQVRTPEWGQSDSLSGISTRVRNWEWVKSQKWEKSGERVQKMLFLKSPEQCLFFPRHSVLPWIPWSISGSSQ